MLGIIIDELFPIANLFRARIDNIRDKMFIYESKSEKQEIKEVIRMRRDIEHYIRKTRPLKNIINVLLKNYQIKSSIGSYLANMEGELDSFIEEMNGLKKLCKSIDDE